MLSQCLLTLFLAHHIRNRSSQLFKAATEVASKSRWCLTGTPIHNSLDDYGALLSFIGVPLLMEKSQFDFWITSPINQKRSHCFNILEDLIKATCLRRTKETMQGSLKLPRRTERIEEIELHQTDQVLYEFFRERTAKIAAGLSSQNEGPSKRNLDKGANILTLINFLRYICNNGEELLPQAALEVWRSKNNSSMDWEMMRKCNQKCDSCGLIIEEPDLLSNHNPEFICHHTICTICSMQSDDTFMEEVKLCPKCASPCATAKNSSSPPNYPNHLSAKVEALIQNLNAEQTVNKFERKTVPVKR